MLLLLLGFLELGAGFFGESVRAKDYLGCGSTVRGVFEACENFLDWGEAGEDY